MRTLGPEYLNRLFLEPLFHSSSRKKTVASRDAQASQVRHFRVQWDIDNKHIPGADVLQTAGTEIPKVSDIRSF